MGHALKQTRETFLTVGLCVCKYLIQLGQHVVDHDRETLGLGDFGIDGLCSGFWIVHRSLPVNAQLHLVFPSLQLVPALLPGLGHHLRQLHTLGMLEATWLNFQILVCIPLPNRKRNAAILYK